MYSPTEMQLTRPATVSAPILCVGGARPNFVKIVPLIRAMRRAIPPLHVSLCILGSITPIVDAERPAAVLVVGDVNSTIACALVVAKERRRRDPRRSEAAQLRPYDAGGDQPRTDR